MNLRQTKFVAEYLRNGGHATKAAIAAGYTPESAGRNSTQIMKSKEVQAAIQGVNKRIIETGAVSKQELVTLCKNIVSTDLRHILSWDGQRLTVKSFDDIPDWAHPAIESIKQRETFSENGGRTVTLEIKLVSKGPIIDELNRMLGFLAPAKTQEVGPSRKLIIVRPPRANDGTP